MKNRRLFLSCMLLVISPVLTAQERIFGIPDLADTATPKAEIKDIAKPAKPKPSTPVSNKVASELEGVASELEVDAPVIRSSNSYRIVIELIEDERKLNGELLDTQNLPVETAFGPASIPLTEILGIRLSRSATETTTVVLHNGDMITGQVNITTLMIQTNWGKAEINGSNLASIFFRKGLAWESLNLLGGPRWTLREVAGGASATKTPRTRTLAAQ